MDFRKLINTIDKLESKKILTETTTHRPVVNQTKRKVSETTYTGVSFKKGSIADALLSEAPRKDPNDTQGELDALQQKGTANSQAFRNAPAAEPQPAAQPAAAEPAQPAAAEPAQPAAAEPAQPAAPVPAALPSLIDIQKMLNTKFKTALAPDGKLGAKTAAAILNYRTTVGKMPGGGSIVQAARGVETRFPTDVAAERKRLFAATQPQGRDAATPAQQPQGRDAATTKQAGPATLPTKDTPLQQKVNYLHSKLPTPKIGDIVWLGGTKFQYQKGEEVSNMFSTAASPNKWVFQSKPGPNTSEDDQAKMITGYTTKSWK
jgi:hypothetical protein